ncbi:MAG: hypothetical protein MAG451_01869 [Anaerolineales bacterium]|nr:hypothetical protein [Anaerolineales bacterium]
MNPDYVDIGAGYAYDAHSRYGDYWTVLVARPTDDGDGTPGESKTRVTPVASAVGWVVSNEPNTNHFGDDDMYAGFYNGLTYMAGVQFDLSEVPSNAQLTSATLKLKGQSAEYLAGNGTWTVRMLASSADFDWSSHGYSAIESASSAGTVGTPLTGSDLEVGQENVLTFSSSLLSELADRLQNTRYVSFRIQGPGAGGNDIFSWDSGYGADSIEAPPVLTVNYTRP